MNQGRSSRHAITMSAASYGAALLAAVFFTSTSGDAHAQTSSDRQPLDGPNVTMDRDLAAGALLDSLIEPLAENGRANNAATRALGGSPSKASVRPQWTARLARNPKKGDGNPPYVLIDRYGGIQRYVEETPSVDLDSHLGQ